MLVIFQKKIIEFTKKKSIISHKKGCKFQPLAIGCLMDPKGRTKKKEKIKQTNKQAFTTWI